MGGFAVSFDVPFSAADVFKELLHEEHQLGINTERVTFETVKKGDGPVEINGLAIGYVRRTIFGEPFSGTTVSEITALEDSEDQKLITWTQLESDTKMQLIGTPAAPPRTTIALTASPKGTNVSITYEFDKVKIVGALCCLAPAMPSLLKWHMGQTIEDIWTYEMSSGRGYDSVEVGGKKLFRQQQADISEEKLIKERAASKPPPPEPLDKLREAYSTGLEAVSNCLGELVKYRP